MLLAYAERNISECESYLVLTAVGVVVIFVVVVVGFLSLPLSELFVSVFLGTCRRFRLAGYDMLNLDGSASYWYVSVSEPTYLCKLELSCFFRLFTFSVILFLK